MVLDELVSSPLNLALAAICAFLLVKLLTPVPRAPPPSSSTPSLSSSPQTNPTSSSSGGPRTDISIDELLLHDGLHADHPEIWLCVNGKVFDVTRGRSFYGPGGGYAAFAGRDATRALAKMDTGAATRTYAVVSDLTEEEINTAKHWEATFAGKYQFVGTLAPQAN